jgi:hypothetical protein
MRVVDLDKRIIQLGAEILNVVQKQEERLFGGNQDALRLYNVILQIEETFDEQGVAKLVERVFKEHPDYSLHEMIPILVRWYKSNEGQIREVKSITKVKEKNWLDLDVKDLRYQYAYCKEEKLSLVEQLEQNGQMFDLDGWAEGY